MLLSGGVLRTVIQLVYGEEVGPYGGGYHCECEGEELGNDSPTDPSQFTAGRQSRM